MENHFHLVVQTLRANLSEFMRHLNICYTGWFNHRHCTCGHLYQGRYKALLVDADKYLLELARYVHLNPVRVGRYCRADYHERWKYVRGYPWSSLAGYLGKEKVVDFVSYDMVLAMIGGRASHRRFLADGLRNGVEEPYVHVQHQTVLGDDDFVASVRRRHVKEGSFCEQPMYRRMVSKVIVPAKVMACVGRVLGFDISQVQQRSGDSLGRCLMADLLYRYSGIGQREIGELLGGVGYTAVSMMRRHLMSLMEEDRGVKVKYDEAEALLHSIED